MGVNITIEAQGIPGGSTVPLTPVGQSVATFADLGSPAINFDGEIWFVRQQTGVWNTLLVNNRKNSGFYESKSGAWEPANDPLQYFLDDGLAFKDSADQTKVYTKQLAGIPTGTIIVESYHGNVDWTGSTIGQVLAADADGNYSPVDKVSSVVPGNNIMVDPTDPQNPIVSSVGTTAGLIGRAFFTGDEETPAAITYYLSKRDDKGTVASVTQQVINGDDIKTFFGQDVLSLPVTEDTCIPQGNYNGQLSCEVDSNSANQRYTIEVYRADADGVALASGVAGAPTGDLGVTVIAILDSGIIDLTSGNPTQVNLSGTVTEDLTILNGQRVRYHVSGEKVGTAGANVTFDLNYGSDHNSYVDVPVVPTTDQVINKSTVPGSTTTAALDHLLSKIPILNKTLTYEGPTASDDITIFKTDVAITVQEVIAVSIGTTPSTTYQLKYSTDRSAAGSNLTDSEATTSTTTGDTATLDDATIPANSWVWLETTAASGTDVFLSVDIRYTED